jgi:hypothetical protein
MRISSIGSALLILFSCGRSHDLKYYSDPYLDSFRRRGMRYMICFDADDSLVSDTITFDKEGNIIELKSFGLNERRSYDSLYFVKHILRINDTPSNHFINYFFNNKGQLVQEWREVNHLDWSLEESQTDKVSRVILFELDGNGRITQEIDTTGNELALLIYDKNETLSRKDIFSITPKRLLRSWDYSYDVGTDKLKTISLNGNGSNILTHYYSKIGLLDSTAYFVKGYTTKYRYLPF